MQVVYRFNNKPRQHRKDLKLSLGPSFNFFIEVMLYSNPNKKNTIEF